MGIFAPEMVHRITSWEGGGSTGRESLKPGETGDPLGRATNAPHRRELPPDKRVSPASDTGATVGFCWTYMGWKDH